MSAARAERRRAEKARVKAEQRRHGEEGVNAFSSAACQGAASGALENYIIPAAYYPLLLAGAAAGEPTTSALARAITTCMMETAKRAVTAPETAFLCLDCDAKFGPNLAVPVAFSVALPFSNRDAAIVTGICAACAESGQDLQAMALRRLRSLWPDAYLMSAAGRA